MWKALIAWDAAEICDYAISLTGFRAGGREVRAWRQHSLQGCQMQKYSAWSARVVEDGAGGRMWHFLCIYLFWKVESKKLGTAWWFLLNAIESRRRGTATWMLLDGRKSSTALVLALKSWWTYMGLLRSMADEVSYVWSGTNETIVRVLEKIKECFEVEPKPSTRVSVPVVGPSNSTWKIISVVQWLQQFSTWQRFRGCGAWLFFPCWCVSLWRTRLWQFHRFTKYIRNCLLQINNCSESELSLLL